MMRLISSCAMWLVCFGLWGSDACAETGSEPLWAYGYSTPSLPSDKPPSQTPPPSSRKPRAGESLAEQMRPRHVEGSGAAFSEIDVHDGGNVADWFPGDHPPMSHLLLHGPAKLGATSWGCAFCHLPTGRGRPENAPVAGQSVAYFLRQLDDFRNNARALRPIHAK